MTLIIIAIYNVIFLLDSLQSCCLCLPYSLTDYSTFNLSITMLGKLLTAISNSAVKDQCMHLLSHAVQEWSGLGVMVVTPRAHARSGVKQSVLSVWLICQSSVARKKLKSRHIDPQKPSKWSQTIANSKKLLCVYLTEVKALRFAVFRLFPAFHNYS